MQQLLSLNCREISQSEESGEQRNMQGCDLFVLITYTDSVGRKGVAAGSFS